MVYSLIGLFNLFKAKFSFAQPNTNAANLRYTYIQVAKYIPTYVCSCMYVCICKYIGTYIVILASIDPY